MAPMLPSRAFADSLDGLVAKAKAAGEDRVVMGGGTGAYVDTVAKYFYKPFTEATGIKVDVVGGSYGERIAKLTAMKRVGAVEWDLIAMSIDALTPDVTPLLRDLGQCEAVPNVAANGVSGSCLGKAVMFDIGGGVLTYDTRAFPNGGPKNWAEFWDVKRFPGPRALPNFGTPWWVMVAALLADGVPRDKLFPLDMDRAFKKLDEIKPHIAVWWNSGDQSQQMFRSGEVVMAMMFSGRAARLRDDGLPLNVVWDGAPLDAAVWAPVDGGPHPNAALALLNFVYTRPEVHVQYMDASKGATAMRSAIDLMEPTKRAELAVSPQNWSSVVRIDPTWLAANSADARKRWTTWIAS
ncbi:ABC transporter substrate-binding protein [Microvirga sp. VF16]|uniref:ABC transporter substrate-binding protein n=1 Tax=Microvirga sp. VF16 TaxID=2807101 RepID=UPI001FEF55D4|nr:ABC transporter substrate-binding protein [Microvirga sp. VF16]